MTDKKLTDSEIVNALSKVRYGGHGCKNCKYDNGKGDDRCGLKGCKIARYALDLITRQQAEIENLKVENQSLRGAANSLKMHYEEAQANIERLKKIREADKKLITSLNKCYETAKSEAVKEFAERLKKEAITRLYSTNLELKEIECVEVEDIDYLAKEMVGENNG